ncbi:MAG TPA: 1-deoxy-D-xylulose-5-phosphate reductoisomerase [Firmicutes bacterium]|jgi:1-deoxy-D-xylulose-5-phosphate reductoisomerase|nr:1-deoxy-D-xylulose-5-phosphate reductoisomerase [Bacillota bacterium]
MEFLSMTRIILLGASGSIGRQTLDVIEAFPRKFLLVAFSVGEKIHLIEGILAKHQEVMAICVKNEEILPTLRKNHPDITFYHGDEGLIKIIDYCKADMVVNALVGFVGLAPTIFSLKRGIDVALANKEALVVGGPLVMEAAKSGKSALIPIDSEHVALDKLLRHELRSDVKKIILTASGGSLYHYGRSELKHVTIDQALTHPTWIMGPKITIDSSTMMNKGFEIIEAHYLFDMPLDQIDVWLHPTSKIHSMIQLVDGTLLADIGLNNMHIPISYALFRRKRVHLPFLKYEPQPETLKVLELKRVSEERFPALALARLALAKGGTAPAVLNGANEIAVASFLNGSLRFDLIETLIETVLEAHQVVDHPTLEQLIIADEWARKNALKLAQEWQS